MRSAFRGVALASLFGCATASAPPGPPPQRSVERLVPAPSSFGPGASLRAVDVRLASEADVEAIGPRPGQTRDVLKASGALLLGSGVLAALGCPICLSNAVAAAGLAIVGVPTMAAITAVERHDQEHVERALQAGDLPAQVRAALARLRPAAPTEPLPGEPAASLLVVGFGFAEAGEHGACFFVDARLRLGSHEAPLLLGPWRRSEDAPAPHCATRSQLAADDGALVRRIVAESGEILAGMATRRLEGTP